MSDQADCTFFGLPHWEDSIFREGFLVPRLKPDEAKTLRDFGATVYKKTLGFDGPPLSSTRLEMIGAARDLNWLQRFMADTGKRFERSSINEADVRLSLLAGELAPLLEALLERLAQGIGPEVEAP